MLDFLDAIFSHDIDRMASYSRIKEDSEAMKEVEKMGGFGRAIAEKNRQEGRQEGRREGRQEGRREGMKEERNSILNNIIKNLMEANSSLTKEQAMEQAKALMA